MQPRYEKVHSEVSGEKANIDRNKSRRFHKMRPDQPHGIDGVTILSCNR